MKQQYEDYIEYQARIIINKLSKYIGSLFIRIRIMLDKFSDTIKTEESESLFKPGTYYPIGLLVFLLGNYLLITSKSVFSPDYIVYFFMLVFIVGIYLLRNR